MIVRTHFNAGRLILAICDEDIFNKKFAENELQLDLSSGFYAGEGMNDKEAKKLVESAYMINAVGEKSVALCIKAGIVDKKNIKKIKNVPYAYMVRF